MNTAELAAALKKADAAAQAGDQQAAEDARRLAAALQKARAQPQQPAAPKLDPLHMVKPEAREQVAARQAQGWTPQPQPEPVDPLAPVDPANQALVARQRDEAMEARRAQEVADAHAQFKAREAQKAAAAQAQADQAQRRQGSMYGIPNSVRDDVFNAIKGVAANVENSAFGVVDAGLDLVDKDRVGSKFVSEQVTPRAVELARLIEGRDGRFGDVPGAITGGLTEWGATMARDPQQGLTEAVDILEPTHQLARGSNTTGDALNAAIMGDFNEAGQLMQQATPDLIGGMGVIPGLSMTASAIKNAATAPTREVMEQMARIQFRPQAATKVSKAPAGSSTAAPLPAAALSRPEQRAADIFLKKLAADGLTIDDVRKVQASLARRGDSGVYETSGELAALSGKSSGANLRGLQMAAGAAPGPAQEALVSLVNENAANLPKRLSRGATRATGQKADNAVATLDELETRLRTEAAPAYDEAYATPVDPRVFQNEILPVLNTPSGQEAIQAARGNLAAKVAELQGRAARGVSERAQMEWKRAEEALKSIDEYLIDPVRGSAVPTTMALDYTKRAFDDVITKAGHGSDTARIVRGTKNNFSDSVSQATGGKYGGALGVFEDVKRLEEAFEVGLGALSKKTWQLEREMAKGRGGSQWTAGEVEAIAMGVARGIEDMIEANDQRALTALLKDKALKNIATALGSEKAAKTFEDTIRRLGANREWGRRVAGGSDTAMRQAAIRDAGMETEDAVTKVLDRVESSGNTFSIPGLINDVAVKPVARTARSLYQRLRYPGVYDEDVNRALIPLIATAMTKGNFDELVKRIETRLAEKGKTGRAPGGGSPPDAMGFATPGVLPELAVGGGSAAIASMQNPDTDGDGIVSEAEALAHNAKIGGSFVGGAVGTRAVRSGVNALRGKGPPKPTLPVTPPPVKAGAPKAEMVKAPPAQPVRQLDPQVFESKAGQGILMFEERPFWWADDSLDISMDRVDAARELTLPETKDLFQKMYATMRETMEREGRSVYSASGDSPSKRKLYDHAVRVLPPPAGYTVMKSPSSTALYFIRDDLVGRLPEGAPTNLERIAGAPPVSNGFGGGKPPGVKGASLSAPIVDAYQAIKQAILSNDPRRMNEAATALQGLPAAEREWIIRNAGLENPQALIDAGQTPEAVAELLGRVIRTDNAASSKVAHEAVRSRQQAIIDSIMGEQRTEIGAATGKPDYYGQRDIDVLDPMNADPKAGPIGPLESDVAKLDRQMAQAWFPARQAERDAAMANLLSEGQKPGGGVPASSPELDRLREGLNKGYEAGPLEMPPEDIDRLMKIILDPAAAKQGADLVQNPVRPWVSEGERRAIDLGVKGAAGGGVLAAMIMGQGDVASEADSPADMRKLRAETGEAPPENPELPILGKRGPYEVLPDGLMPTANPAQSPDWLNGGLPDTRKRAQMRYVALGYAPAKLPNGKPFADGVEGFATREATERYQRDNKLPVTGDLDPITLRHLLLREENYGPEPFVRPRGRALADAVLQ